MNLGRRGFFGAIAATIAASVVGVAPLLARRGLQSVSFDRASALLAVKIYPPTQLANQAATVINGAAFAEIETVWGRQHLASVAGSAVITEVERASYPYATVEKEAYLRDGVVSLFDHACERGYWEEHDGRRIPFTAIRFLSV